MVAELVGARHLVGGTAGTALVARVNLGEDLALLDDVAPLAPADDADRVVDRVALDTAARPEVQSGDPDPDRVERDDRARPRRRDLVDVPFVGDPLWVTERLLAAGLSPSG